MLDIHQTCFTSFLEDVKLKKEIWEVGQRLKSQAATRHQKRASLG